MAREPNRRLQPMRGFRRSSEAPEGGSDRAKVWLLGGFIVLLFGILTVQLVRLQILQHDEYVARAAINRVRTVDLAPTRGLIYARDGTPLVENVPAYRITLIAAEIDDEDVERVAAELAELFSLRTWEIEEQIWQRKRSNDPFFPIVISDEASDSLVFDLTSRRAQLSGVRVESVGIRKYTHGALLGQILGYVGRLNQEEYEELQGERYLYTDWIGKTGVEAAYESQLRGRTGRQQVEIDVVGNVLEVLNETPPEPGLSIVLTIDLELQQRVQEILEAHLGASRYAAAVVLDVNTGQVLALVSIPTYDVNIYSEDLSEEEWTALIEDPGQPLRNHAISDQYPPGSIFKVVTATAALAEGTLTPETRIYTPGVLEVHNRVSPGIVYLFGDTVQNQVLDLRQALSESSNVYFYYAAGGDPYRRPDEPPRHPSEQARLDALADEGIIAGDVEFDGVGHEALGKWARAFGLDSETGIDLAGEVSGLIPTAEQKLESLGEPWFDGDTYNMAIGQGFMSVTPLQMAVVTATIANGGTVYEPRVVLEVRDGDGRAVQPWQPVVRARLELDPEVLRIVREGMALCLLAGTCHDALVALPEMMTAGKTGTAEFNQTGTAVSGAEEGPTHGWYIAFAPFEEPQIAIAVFFEFSAGYLASSAGGEILRAWAERSGAILNAEPPPYARVALTAEEDQRLSEAIRARSN